MSIKDAVRRVGIAGEFYQDTKGAWWLINPQTGFVSVPETDKGLQEAIVETKAMFPDVFS